MKSLATMYFTMRLWGDCQPFLSRHNNSRYRHVLRFICIVLTVIGYCGALFAVCGAEWMAFRILLGIFLYGRVIIAIFSLAITIVLSSLLITRAKQRLIDFDVFVLLVGSILALASIPLVDNSDLMR